MKRILKKKIFLVLLLITILVSAFFPFSGILEPAGGNTEKLSPRQGVLDLSGWNPAQGSLINLSGGWEFYWLKLLDYDGFLDADAKPDLFAEIPKVWNTYNINGENLPGFGYATYRLKVIDAETDQALAIRMSTVSTAYNLYINDKLVASSGRIGADERHFTPEYRPDVAEFTPVSKDFDIILQVANFSYARGGAWYPIFLGACDSVIEYDKTIAYKDLLIIGALLIMALYFLCFYFLRMEDKSSLYFVVLCLIAVGRTIIYGDYIINRLFPWADYHVIVAVDYIAGIWGPVLYVLLNGELFPEQTSRKLKKTFVAYAVVISLFVGFSPVHVFTSVSYPIEIVMLAMVTYAVACSVRAFMKAEADAAITLAGSVSIVLGVIHDILYQNNIISSGFGEMASFGFLIFLFLHSFVLAKRFSKALKDAKLLSEKLLKLDKLKDEFLANTSHELRTPLNAMINIADGISRGTEGVVNERQKTGLSMIISSGKRLVNLINDILDYSKLKNFDLKLNFEAVKLKGAVESVLNVLGWQGGMDKVKMLIDIPEDLPCIYADENRLIQILYNLIGNAIKYTEAGYVRVSAYKTGEIIEACVEDTGTGIPEDKLDVIFEAFSRLEDSLTRRSGGTGLGLSITKYLVEAHGGKMRVESKIGKGSKFYFSVPVSTEAAREKSRRFDTEEAEAAAGHNAENIKKFPYRYKSDGPHIMLVDDNETNLVSLAGILRMENYSVTAVTSSKEFFEEFKKENELSLVIVDVMLPGMSGYDICREIRKTFSVSEMPVLMLTARTMAQDIVSGMEAGANDYMAKPFDTGELLARVGTLVQLKQSVDKALASELAFLQAQIKPHFLYNALNTFVSISRYDIDKARCLISEFSNYLRRSFDFRNPSQTVPLKNELDLLRAYLEIEKARFEERIEVNCDLPEDMEIAIPILILQPIVENAIIHGILPKPEGGRVDIAVRMEERGLHIKVKDNGVGMDEVKCRKALSDEGTGGIGLFNIDKRLRRLYGQGLQIASKPEVGTEIDIFIPQNTR